MQLPGLETVTKTKEHVVEQWSLTEVDTPPNGGANPYTLHNVESFLNKFTNKHTFCLYNLFKVRGLELKQRTIT